MSRLTMYEFKMEDCNRSGTLLLLSETYKHAVICHTNKYETELMYNNSFKEEHNDKQKNYTLYCMNYATEENIGILDTCLFYEGYFIINIPSCIKKRNKEK